ncbi:MAG: MFS transporter [Anaerolineales bacterium]|nr:MFS transporter [Chloroflexota bacterium]MBL6980998.1 MFS transporter [Anaerolineales bacterium]
MKGFTVVWIGQIISLIGTAMSNFALTLWAYEITGKATPLALVGFFFVTPMVILGPFVGALIDRSNRKIMMMLSDLSAAVTMLVVLILFLTDNLQIWHLYVSATVTGIFQGFQWPAYSAAISVMLPKEQYARANGMLELAGNASFVVAPLLAGALIAPLGIGGILSIDLVSAVFAITTLLLVNIPQPDKSAAGHEGDGNFFQEAAYGFRYIFARPSLFALQLVFLIGNFFNALAFSVFAPMILSRTGNNEIIFGSVQSIGAVGGVLGGLAMTAWGGFNRRIHGVLLGWICAGFFGQMVTGLGNSLLIWGIGIFIVSFFAPILNASNQAIWQAKVPPDVQGRVFSTRRLIAWFASPLSWLIAGPLADNFMEPAMSEGGQLAPVFGWMVGTGTGAGIALMFVFSGILLGITGLIGYMFPAVRRVEQLLPDHDA